MDAAGGYEVNAALPSTATFCGDYALRLQAVLASADWSGVARLAEELLACWKDGRQVFICGNGGSAGNAVHLANDFLYGISKVKGSGLRVHALSANTAVLTCLANDEGYDHIYSTQLAVHARAGDLLMVLSGSGNSANIVEVLQKAREMGVRSYAVLGYTGGKSLNLADVPIHFKVEDMQIAEDMQLVVGHMVMQWLYQNRLTKA
jgi:D-sedoheptulose 7-phosphate isomerase